MHLNCLCMTSVYICAVGIVIDYGNVTPLVSIQRRLSKTSYGGHKNMTRVPADINDSKRNARAPASLA
jgi:hypothetical protein